MMTFNGATMKDDKGKVIFHPIWQADFGSNEVFNNWKYGFPLG